MRICLLTRSIPLHVPGGFEKYIFDIAFGLAARGHEVHLITKHLPKSCAIKEIPRLNQVRIHYVGPRSPVFWHSFSFFIGLGRKIAQLHATHPFDLIHSNGFAGFGLFVVRPTWKNTPVVSTVHGITMSDYLAHARTLIQRIIRSIRFIPVVLPEFFTYLKSDQLLCITPRVIHLLKQLDSRFPRKAKVIYNGVDASLFFPRPYLPVPSQEATITILYAGTISKAKGIPTLYRVFKQLSLNFPFLRLRLAGDGPVLNEIRLQTEADHLQSSIHFDGYVNPAHMPDIYREADIFVMPTETQEGLPFAILEALSSGLAVIASDACFLGPLFSKYKCGLTYKAGDVPSLANLIVKLVKNPHMGMELGRSGRQMIQERFSKDVMVNEVEMTYFKLLKRDSR